MPRKSKVPIYLKAPQTSRHSDKLARYYGHPDHKALANSLPENSKVIDVGAGYTKLGHNVCYIREDIEWVNVDPAYNKRTELFRYINAPNIRPANLTYLSADVLTLTDEVGEGTFDRVFSFWLMPHILLGGKKAGRLAAQNMLEVAQPNGTVSIGPDFRGREITTIDFDAPQNNIEANIDEIVNATKLGVIRSVCQRALNNFRYRMPDPANDF